MTLLRNDSSGTERSAALASMACLGGIIWPKVRIEVGRGKKEPAAQLNTRMERTNRRTVDCLEDVAVWVDAGAGGGSVPS